MSPSVDLILVWHHHQPDYRRALDRRAALPWVRLHATKDYLDMARHLERHPGVRVTFNLVPSLVDQLEDAVAGVPDALFELMSQPVAHLSSEQRRELAHRCRIMPRWALEAWPLARAPREAAQRWVASGTGSGPTNAELTALVVWFLLAWVDPLFHEEPEAAAALVDAGRLDRWHVEGLLALHARLMAQVLPAYAALARRGQVELSASPYYHPILPLLADVRTARRARPDLALPSEPFEAPEDARAQIERGLERHARAFGARPQGMWPSEGSVSPEVVALAAASGVRWLASDEGVLWGSLPAAERRQGALFRPWQLATAEGTVTLFFRHHELSDRIGFVYQRWDAAAAVDDFLARLRRIGADHPGPVRPVVAVILDGENCWEGYAGDGREFLDRLYGALEAAPDIRTRTPSDVLADPTIVAGRLAQLHSGSWIDADFRIWIGHPEKNRAWDLIARARRGLIDQGATPATHPAAWDSLYRAEGSDWFWWFGEDHFTADKALFDRLFREHVKAIYDGAGMSPPAALEVPISTGRALARPRSRPTALLTPVIDGRRSQYFEWHGAGRVAMIEGGGAMHRGGGVVRELHYGFDLTHLHLRLDFADGLPGPDVDLVIEFHEPSHRRLVVQGLTPGARPVRASGESGEARPLSSASCHLDQILELSVPFADLAVAAGKPVELLMQLVRAGQPIETLPDEPLRFEAPDPTFNRTMWDV